MDNLTNTPKTIIYLDQFVISNITKLLDPESPRRARVLKEPFWLDLYKKLDRLLRLQLIVCPDSYYHRTESLLSGDPDFDSLQDVYSYLSNDCTFQNDTMILRWQILHYFPAYLDGHPEREPVIPVSEVIFGDLDEWQDRIRVTVPYRSGEGEVEFLRDRRVKQHSSLEEVFKKWQLDRTSFKLSVQEEAQALGQAIMEVFFSHLKEWMSFSLGLAVPQSPLELLPPPAASLVYDMFRVLEGRNISDPMEQLHKVSEYFQSPHFLRVPFVRLSSILYAAIARKAQAGRRSPPNEGTITDVTAIATMLPYCQAMFLDKEMASYLRETPLKEEVKQFGTRIFSLNSKAEFLAYLDELEEKAGERHIKWVKAAYGPKWLNLFVDVVTQGKRSRERDKK